jgi:hypothetical protein
MIIRLAMIRCDKDADQRLHLMDLVFEKGEIVEKRI